LPRIYHRVYP